MNDVTCSLCGTVTDLWTAVEIEGWIPAFWDDRNGGVECGPACSKCAESHGIVVDGNGEYCIPEVQP